MEQSPLRQMALSMLHKWKQPNPGGQRVCSMVLPTRPAIMHVNLRDLPGYKADCSITGSDIENLLFNFPVTLQAMASAMASAGSEEASQ